jgi:Zn-dependent protease with chaperone function
LKTILCRALLGYAMLVRLMPGQGGSDAHSNPSENSGWIVTAQDDRQVFLKQLQSIKGVQKRWAGEMVFLEDSYGRNPEKADFIGRFETIAHRLGIEPPDVIIVKAPLDKNGNPSPQKPDSGVAWTINDGKYRHVVFVTEYLKNGLSDEELLSVLAHEMGHVLQYQNNGHTPRTSSKMEGDADKLALACPEVDPVAYKSMLLKVDKMTDAVARKHPLLYGDITGSTAVIPASVQTKLALGGNHPLTSTRIAFADKEIQRRSAAPACTAPGESSDCKAAPQR